MVRVIKYPGGDEVEVPIKGWRVRVSRILKVLGLKPMEVLVVKEGIPVTEDDYVTQEDVLEIYEVMSTG
ncbi:MAG: hypothetical protein J7L55_06005 [Desulfurococcales archaeon]|nr:hypothetical protein [Desulfurococcales archaeon]